MNQKNVNTYPQSDRLSLLWLVVGCVFFVFMAGNWPLSLAGWLAPLFLIRFMRTQRKLWGFILISIGIAVACTIGYQGGAALPQLPLAAFGAVLGISYGLIFLVDRALVPRLPTQGLASFSATLVFPLLMAGYEFLLLNKTFFGSSGSWAYSQNSSLVLMQIISVTGLWGLTFIISWFASTANWVWERGFSWPVIRGGVAIYASCLLLVLVFGTIRLRFAEPPAGTVRVHTVIGDAPGNENLNSNFVPLMKNDREAFRQLTTSTYDAILEDITREAQAGAQIVILPETAVIGVQEDLDALYTRIKQVAMKENIYVAFGVADTDAAKLRLIVIGPTGEIVLNHIKYGLQMDNIFSRSELQTVDTPYGRLSGVLCADLDNPGVVSQAGRKNVDILLVPATDGPDVGPWHFRMAAFRAVENGVSVVRSTAEGVSLVTDPYGRVLASMDSYKTSDRVMVTQVPIHGAQTVFSATGDWFGWLMVIGFVGLAGCAIFRGRKIRVEVDGSLESKTPSV